MGTAAATNLVNLGSKAGSQGRRRSQEAEVRLGRRKVLARAERTAKPFFARRLVGAFRRGHIVAWAVPQPVPILLAVAAVLDRRAFVARVFLPELGTALRGRKSTASETGAGERQ